MMLLRQAWVTLQEYRESKKEIKLNTEQGKASLKGSDPEKQNDSVLGDTPSDPEKQNDSVFGRNRGGGSGGSRPGDWPCLSCQELNHSYRNQCYKCRKPRIDGGSGDALQQQGNGDLGDTPMRPLKQELAHQKRKPQATASKGTSLDQQGSTEL